jgi:hypothetical protein
MWIEIFNVEHCCIVDEDGENSTVIPERSGKGAGTNPKASEEIAAIDSISLLI